MCQYSLFGAVRTGRQNPMTSFLITITSILITITYFLTIIMLAKKCSGEVTLKALGAELTRRRESVISYVPPEGSSISDSEGKAEQLAKRKWGESSEKFYELAQRIHTAYPKEFKAWGPLAEKLGEVSEEIQQTHAQEWEQMMIALGEMITLEREAYIKELEKKVKKYEEKTKKRGRSQPCLSCGPYT